MSWTFIKTPCTWRRRHGDAADVRWRRLALFFYTALVRVRHLVAGRWPLTLPGWHTAPRLLLACARPFAIGSGSCEPSSPAADLAPLERKMAGALRAAPPTGIAAFLFLTLSGRATRFAVISAGAKALRLTFAVRYTSTLPAALQRVIAASC